MHVLLLNGGLYGLRTVSIIAAFPFMLIMVLRESEREEERLAKLESHPATPEEAEIGKQEES